MLSLLSLDEAAKELRVSIHTIRAWVFQRRFETVKLGRRHMVEREALEAFVHSGVVAARPQGSKPTTAIESGRGHAGKHHRNRGRA